jgi:hypothetical protein
MRRYGGLWVAALSFSAVGLLGCASSVTLPPLDVRVVDGASGQPIADANVLLYVDATEGTLTGHGGAVTNLFLLEGVTDAGGTARFPSHVNKVPSGYNLSGPYLHAYAPGYQFGWGPYAPMISSKSEIDQWVQEAPRVIRLKAATTDAERAGALSDAWFRAQRATARKGSCWLERMPRYLAALEAGIAAWNARVPVGQVPAGVASKHHVQGMDVLMREAQAGRATICPADR